MGLALEYFIDVLPSSTVSPDEMAGVFTTYTNIKFPIL